MTSNTTTPTFDNMQAKQVLSSLVGNGGKKKFGAAMKEAGFSEAYAKNPKKYRATKEFKNLVDPIINKLDAEIDAAINELPKKRGKAGYGELTTAIDKMLGKRELLSGRATNRVEGMGSLLDDLEK